MTWKPLVLLILCEILVKAHGSRSHHDSPAKATAEATADAGGKESHGHKSKAVSTAAKILKYQGMKGLQIPDTLSHPRVSLSKSDDDTSEDLVDATKAIAATLIPANTSFGSSPAYADAKASVGGSTSSHSDYYDMKDYPEDRYSGASAYANSSSDSHPSSSYSSSDSRAYPDGDSTYSVDSSVSGDGTSMVYASGMDHPIVSHHGHHHQKGHSKSRDKDSLRNKWEDEQAAYSSAKASTYDHDRESSHHDSHYPSSHHKSISHHLKSHHPPPPSSHHSSHHGSEGSHSHSSSSTTHVLGGGHHSATASAHAPELQEHQEKKDSSRNYGVAEGWRHENPDGYWVQELAKVAATELNMALKYNHRMKLLKVFQARSQISNGNMYKIEMQIAPTNCKTSDSYMIPDDHCQIQPCSDRKMCHVEVLLTEETGEEFLKDYGCYNVKPPYLC